MQHKLENRLGVCRRADDFPRFFVGCLPVQHKPAHRDVGVPQNVHQRLNFVQHVLFVDNSFD